MATSSNSSAATPSASIAATSQTTTNPIAAPTSMTTTNTITALRIAISTPRESLSASELEAARMLADLKTGKGDIPCQFTSNQSVNNLDHAQDTPDQSTTTNKSEEIVHAQDIPDQEHTTTQPREIELAQETSSQKPTTNLTVDPLELIQNLIVRYDLETTMEESVQVLRNCQKQIRQPIETVPEYESAEMVNGALVLTRMMILCGPVPKPDPLPNGRTPLRSSSPYVSARMTASFPESALRSTQTTAPPRRRAPRLARGFARRNAPLSPSPQSNPSVLETATSPPLEMAPISPESNPPPSERTTSLENAPPTETSPEGGADNTEPVQSRYTIEQLGLTVGNYSTQQVVGKYPVAGSITNGKPTVAYAMYGILARAPKGKMTKKDIHALMNEWWPWQPLLGKDQTIRRGLSKGKEFDFETNETDGKGYWFLVDLPPGASNPGYQPAASNPHAVSHQPAVNHQPAASHRPVVSRPSNSRNLQAVSNLPPSQKRKRRTQVLAQKRRRGTEEEGSMRVLAPEQPPAPNSYPETDFQ